MLKQTIILITFIIIVSEISYSDCLQMPNAFQCVKYLSNYDGDTISVNIKNVHPIIGRDMKIRVKGIDTPEIRGRKKCEPELALKAKNFVASELIGAAKIELRDISRGKYFRIVADVIYDGKNLKAQLIKNKLGVDYNGGTKPEVDWCDYLNPFPEISP